MTTKAVALWSLLLAAMSVVNANVQETLIGITGKDFVILGADSSISSEGSISWTAQVDKIAVLGPIATATAGDIADSDRLVGMLRAHYNLREFETSIGSDVEYITTTGQDQQTNEPVEASQMHGLTVNEVAHLARYQIAESLRSRGRLNVCLLIAGMSKANAEDFNISDYFTERLQDQVRQATNQPSESIVASNQLEIRPRLYWVDQYGSLQALRYGAHGFAANFLLSVLDQGYREDMTKEEAIDLMKSCFKQLRVRYIIHSPSEPNIKCIDQEGCRVVA
ncbi:Proteasome subunit [Fragilaria crotonensis]|nr:Proteasome subunit [Fragilaria crotonensis]